jgi:hypothetical protein
VRAAVELLPDPERQMLLLKVFGEMKYGEISACFGEPVGTVKWRISKAYARLRELLASEMRSGEIEDEPLLESAVLPGRGGRTPAAMAYAAPSRSVSSVLRARQG